MNILLVLLALINIEFSWTVSTGGPKGYKLGTAAVGSTAYVFTDVGMATIGTDGKVHYVWNNWTLGAPKDVVVKAYNDIGESGLSGVIYVGEPGVPANLTATPK